MDRGRYNYKPTTSDYGPNPFIVDINQWARQNSCFRTTLWTGRHLQVTLMCIPVASDIGLEVHHVDQYIRIECGCGLAMMGNREDKLTYKKAVYENYVVFVPAGTWHNIVNTGNRPLKVSSLYAPPEHAPGTVHATKEIAEEEEGY